MSKQISLVTKCRNILTRQLRIFTEDVLNIRANSQRAISNESSESKTPKSQSKISKTALKKQETSASNPVAASGTYKAGESYYSFNPYSFYDLDSQMNRYRLPQPDSFKK